MGSEDLVLVSNVVFNFNTKDCFIFPLEKKMIFSLLYLLAFLIGVTVSRPSKVQKDGLTANPDDEIFIMRKSDLRSDWCKTRPLKQTIKVPGCLPVQVMNNFCYGQCNSLYIPNHASEQPLFESCTTCMPQRSFTKTVTLRCPSLPVKFRKHRYLHSKKCRCTSVKWSTNEDLTKAYESSRSRICRQATNKVKHLISKCWL